MSDRISQPILLSLSGNLFMALALLLVGPAPFLPAAPSVPLILVCLGVGVGYKECQCCQMVADRQILSLSLSLSSSYPILQSVRLSCFMIMT